MKKNYCLFSIFLLFLGILMLSSVNVFGEIIGDIDGSNTIDLKDAILALKLSAGEKLPFNFSADVNGDGKIGLQDAIYVLKNAAGLIQSFIAPVPAGERIFFMKINLKSALFFADIYSMNSAGGDVIRHTNFSDSMFKTDAPMISYSGKALTFISNYKSWLSAFYQDIFLWDFKTNAVKRISGDERPFYPIKTMLLTVAGVPSDHRTSAKGSFYYIMGNGTLRVPADENIWVKSEYGRESSYLAFINTTFTPQVDFLNQTTHSMAVDGGSVSPDGLSIACMIDGKLAVWTINNGIDITNWGGSGLGYSMTPVWSRDGTKIAYGYGIQSLAENLAYVTKNNPQNPIILVQQPLVGAKYNIFNPSWSPDDQEIVFCAAVTGFYSFSINLYKININNPSNIIQLTSDYSGNFAAINPSYSPDGANIVFTVLERKINYGGGIADWFNPSNIKSANLYLIPSNGGTPAPLTNDGISYVPSWGVVVK